MAERVMEIMPNGRARMKALKILIVFLGILFVGSIAPGQLVGQEGAEFKPGSEPDEFRGIKWGADISTLKDMVFVMTIDKNAKRYERKGDELKMGKAKLDYIQYEFQKGKFYLVEMWFQGIENFNHVKETMFEKYGKGRIISEKTESYFWEGEKTDMIMVFDADIGGGITISSK
jgi:hypothetical protein